MTTSFGITGQAVAEILFEYLRRWQATLLSDLDDVPLNFELDDFVDSLCITIANNPGHPLDRERVELRAVLGARIQVMIANAVMDRDGGLLSTPEKPALEMIVGAVFGRLLAGARLPDEWNGRSYRAVAEALAAGESPRS